MTTREVPALATWLLSQFVSGKQRDSLLGDLFEEYQAGRTAGWYWRETLVALFVSMQRGAHRLCSCRGAQSIAVLLTQCLVFAGIVLLSEEYRQRCPTPPALWSGSIVLMLSAGMAQIAIALVARLSPPRRHVRATPRSRLVRLSVAVFAAIGFSGGALTWASTALCSMDPPVCASSPVVHSCARRGEGVSHPPYRKPG